MCVYGKLEHNRWWLFRNDSTDRFSVKCIFHETDTKTLPFSLMLSKYAKYKGETSQARN